MIAEVAKNISVLTLYVAIFSVFFFVWRSSRAYREVRKEWAIDPNNIGKKWSDQVSELYFSSNGSERLKTYKIKYSRNIGGIVAAIFLVFISLLAIKLCETGVR
jgi:hypothetical protein